MSVQVNIDNYLLYFDIDFDNFSYDILTSVFLFASGVRPIEFLNLGVTNIDLDLSLLTFEQAKDGGIRKVNIDYQLLYDIIDLWSSVGNPRDYYGSYSTLMNYIRRATTPKFTISNRLDELYCFRYGCCADLLHENFTDIEINEFFQHINPVNTSKYKSMGNEINSQLGL